MPIRDFQQPFDWTYTTDYKGTLAPNVIAESISEKIDFERLKQRDAILFYSEMTLYEDELADNGCSQVKKIEIRIQITFLLKDYH